MGAGASPTGAYLALSVLVCAVAGAVVALTDGGKSSPAAIALTKPVGLYAAGTVDVGGSPQALLTHAHSLWIATPSSVVRLNLRNGSTIARTPIPTNGVNARLAFGAGSIWLAPTGASAAAPDRPVKQPTRREHPSGCR